MLPRRLILWYLVAAALQSALWYILAPDALCYVQEGECIWQMDQTSSPYFFADLIFGGLGLVLGLGFGWRYARQLQNSKLSQLSAAALALGLGWLGSWSIAIATDVVLQPNSLGIDGLSLRSVSMLFAWPLAVQLLVVFRNPNELVSESELRSEFSESENTSTN